MNVGTSGATDTRTGRILILGGSYIGAALARHLGDDADVILLDPDPCVVARAERAGLTAHEADIDSTSDLREHGVRAADITVVASDDDGTNLLAAQLLRVAFGVERVIVRVNDPQNRDSFEELDIETVCATTVLADRLGENVGVEELHSDIERELT